MMRARRWSFPSIAVVTCLLLAGCGSPEDRAAEYLADGQRLLEEGDVGRAAVQFRNVLRINPNDPAALFGLGQVQEQRRDVVRAFASYRAAADADPSMIDAHNAYAVLALTAGDLDTVRQAVEKITAVAPEDPDGLALGAALALRDEEIDRADELAQKALAAEPGHVNATSALAGVANARGDAASAVALIDHHLDEFGSNVPLVLLKIQLLAARDDVTGVAEGFRQLVAYDPNNAEFRLAFADFYRGQGDVEGAEQVLRDALGGLDMAPVAGVALVRLVREQRGLETALAEIDALRGRAPALDEALSFLAADMLSADGRLDEAEATLQAIVDDADASVARRFDARACIATVDYARGDRETAESRLLEVLEGDPDHRGANYLLGVLRLENGDLSGAVAAGREALAQDPEWTPALKLLAQAHLGSEDRNLAINALRRAVEAAPDDIESASMLARLLTEDGQYDAALRVWDHVIGQSGDASSALSSTAEIAIRQEDWNRASSDIDRLLATPGNELSGALLAGSLRLAQSDPAGAREWFARAREIDPDVSAALLGLVRSHLAEDDIDAALVTLDERTTARPDDALAHNLTAQLQLQRGALDDAAVAYRAAISAQPMWPTPYQELARLQERTGDVDAAIATLDDGVAANADRNGNLRLSRAFVEQRAGRYGAAIATYEALLDAGDQRDLVVNNYAALVADFAYDNPEALSRALELAGRFEASAEPYFLDTLGWLHFREGDVARALPYLRRAAAIRPDDPHIRYHVGAAFHALGDEESALAELRRATTDGADYAGIEDARALLARLERNAASTDATVDGQS